MKKSGQFLLGILLFLILWQTLASILRRTIILPSPAETLPLLFQYLFSGDVLLSVWQTTWKATLALALAVLVGLPVGFCLGLWPALYRVFRPGVMFIQAVPVISWLTLVIFVWGVGWKGPIFITFLALLPMSILTTVSGVRSLDIDLLEMARLYRVPRVQVWKQIHLGSLLPFIAAILDVSIGQAWKVILVAEYLCGGSGLGERILTAHANIDTSSVWALTLIAVMMGILMEFGIKLVARKVSPAWRPN